MGADWPSARRDGVRPSTGAGWSGSCRSSIQDGWRGCRCPSRLPTINLAGMKSTILSRRDLDFLLYEWLDVEKLTTLDRFTEHSRETFDGVLDLCEQLATRYFAPHNKLSDANEPTFDGQTVTLIPDVKEAWDAFAAADLIAMGMDAEIGGAQLPVTVAQAAFAWISAANVSTSGYLMLTIANANLLAHFGTGRADRDLRQTDAGGPVLGHHGAVGDPGRIVAGRHHHPRRTAGRRHVTGCSAPRCGSPAPSMSSPRTSSTWCWPRFPVARPAPRASRCSSCRSSWPTAPATGWPSPG